MSGGENTVQELMSSSMIGIGMLKLTSEMNGLITEQLLRTSLHLHYRTTTQF